MNKFAWKPTLLFLPRSNPLERHPNTKRLDRRKSLTFGTKAVNLVNSTSLPTFKWGSRNKVKYWVIKYSRYLMFIFILKPFVDLNLDKKKVFSLQSPTFKPHCTCILVTHKKKNPTVPYLSLFKYGYYNKCLNWIPWFFDTKLDPLL